MHRLGERVGDFRRLSKLLHRRQYKMTIWHTEIPPSLQHMGIGGNLLEEAVQLALRDSSRLLIGLTAAL